MDKVNDKLTIVGAGPMGREAKEYALDTGKFSSVEMVDVSIQLDQLVGSYACSIGNPGRRAELVQKLVENGASFATIVHPLAYVGRRVSLGEGCIISPFVAFTCDIKVGRHVIINTNSSIGHDCVIGDYVYIGPGCHISGRCTIPSSSYVRAGTVLQPDTTFQN